MVVTELFYSLQGEGGLAGVPSVFVRLAGCPLRCRWCDTKYAWDGGAGDVLTAEQILKKISDHPTRYAVVTGGEPMVHTGIDDLATVLHREDYHVTVETAGIAFIPDLPVDLMSISPKLSNSVPTASHEPVEQDHGRLDIAVLNRLMKSYPYQLKFVVDTPGDLDEIAEVLTSLDTVNPDAVYLMPQASTQADYVQQSRWLADYCLQTGFRFSPRLQVMLWPKQRGK